MKTVIITGGSRGIGAACVEAFAQSGWDVVFTYKNSAEKAKELKDASGARAVRCDMADPAAVKAALGSIDADALVCCAGVARSGLIQDMTDDDYDYLFDNNVRSVFNAVRAAVPGMIRRQSGCITAVSSVWGDVGGSCEALYSASKGAVSSLAKALAKELGPSGIRVNCVSPGNIITDMTLPLGEETLRDIAGDTPLCRNGRPEDVAAAILWLSSDGASFITGQTVGVDGGWRG